MAAPDIANLWSPQKPVHTQAQAHPELAPLATSGHAQWITGDYDLDKIAGYKTTAGPATMVLSMYAIPGRDNGLYSAGGYPDRASYLTFLRAIRDRIGTQPTILVLEADALGLSRNLSASAKAERIDTLRQAVGVFATSSATMDTYIDASMWVPTGEQGDLLKSVDVSTIAGFAINTSNFEDQATCLAYGEAVVAALAARGVSGKRYVIDTARNGAGKLTSAFPGSGPWFSADRTWCNPPGRRPGVPSGTRYAAYPSLAGCLWVKGIGESDGDFPTSGQSGYFGGSAPAAGQFWLPYARDLLGLSPSTGAAPAGAAPRPSPLTLRRPRPAGWETWRTLTVQGTGATAGAEVIDCERIPTRVLFPAGVVVPPVKITNANGVVVTGAAVRALPGNTVGGQDQRLIQCTDARGTVHLEGLDLDAAGADNSRQSDALLLGGAGATFVVQNVRAHDLHGAQPQNHADGIQIYQATKELWVDGFVVTGDYQGIKGQLVSGEAPIEKVTLSNVDLIGIPRTDTDTSGGYLLWVNPNGETPWTLNNVRADPRGDRALGESVWPPSNWSGDTNRRAIESSDHNTVTWPASVNVTGKVTRRGPSDLTDYVPAATVGLNYPTSTPATGAPVPVIPATFPDGTAYPTFGPATRRVDVTTSAALTSALAAASAGTRIVLADGTYSGQFSVTGKRGTSSAGISVEAATVGGAVFASGSTFTVKDSSHVVISGLVFPNDQSVASVRGASDHVQWLECTFGPPTFTASSATSVLYLYVADDAKFVTVDCCLFRNKGTGGNMIRVYGNFDTQQVAQYVLVDHCRFDTAGPEIANDKEPIRFGVSSMSRSDALGVVERCLFTGIAAEPEVVSIKAGRVRATGNTLLKCAGGIVIRHGRGSVVSDNYVIDRVKTTGTDGLTSGGIRFYDSGHTVERNYLDGLNGANYQASLLIDTGDTSGTSTNLSGHWQVAEALVQRNLVVNSAVGIQVGDNYSLAPTAVTLVDNICAGVAGTSPISYVGGTTLAGASMTARNVAYPSPAEAGATQDADGIWRRDGYGPRLSYLTAATTGPGSKAAALADGTGAAVTSSSGSASGGGTAGGSTSAPTPTAPSATATLGAAFVADTAGTSILNTTVARGPYVMAMARTEGPVTDVRFFAGSTYIGGASSDRATTDLTLVDAGSVNIIANYTVGGVVYRTGAKAITVTAATTGAAAGTGASAAPWKVPSDNPYIRWDLWSITEPPSGSELQGLVGRNDPPWFQVGPSGGSVQFEVNSSGATTTNTTYPRSELREYYPDASTKAAWSLTSGTHTLVCRTSVAVMTATVKPQVVVGQIHNATDDVIELLWDQLVTGRANGADAGLGVRLNGATQSTYLSKNLSLGQVFDYAIDVPGDGSIDIYFKTDLTRDFAATDLGLHFTPAQVSNGIAAKTGMYFKAGAYLQTNESKGDTNKICDVQMIGLGAQHAAATRGTGKAPTGVVGAWPRTPAAGSGTTGATSGPPASVLDLHRFHLTLPTGSGATPTQVNQPALATFVDPTNFYASTSAVVFRAPEQGVTTSAASGAVRCELREHDEGTYASSGWSPVDGKRRSLGATMVVNATTCTDRKEVIVGQIHSDTDTPPIYLTVEQKDGFTPRLRVFAAGPGYADLLTGITPTTTFSWEIVCPGDGSVLLYAVLGAGDPLAAKPLVIPASTFGSDTTGWYFKVGAYNKSKIADGGAGFSTVMISKPLRMPLPSSGTTPATGGATTPTPAPSSGLKPWRTGGVNIFQLAVNDYPSKRVMSHAEIDSLLDKALALGARFVRSHTLGISIGNDAQSLVRGVSGTTSPVIQYTAAVWEAIDYAIAGLARRGMYAEVPLTDWKGAYHGGLRHWVNFRRPGTCSLDPAVDASNSPAQRAAERYFFTDPQIVADFNQYTRDWLTHVNVYTGRQNRDEPAVAFLSPGNELWMAAQDTPTWTPAWARLVKSIAPDVLVMDGSASDGQAIVDAHLNEPAIDAHGTHPYSKFTAATVTAQARAVAAKGKAYLVDEYPWSKNTAPAIEAAARAEPNVFTTALWSLQNDADLHNGGGASAYGTDDASFYVPGKTSTETTAVSRVTTHHQSLTSTIPSSAEGN